MAGHAVELTDANFESEALQATGPVLVDFWAPWCMPCRMIAPMIEELAADNLGSAKIAKVNVDNARQTAVKYGIQNIPTLILLVGGEVRQRWQGAPPKATLQSAIDAAKPA